MLNLKIQVSCHFHYSCPSSDPYGFVPGVMDLLPSLHQLCGYALLVFIQAKGIMAHSVVPVPRGTHIATKASPHLKEIGPVWEWGLQPLHEIRQVYSSMGRKMTWICQLLNLLKWEGVGGEGNWPISCAPFVFFLTIFSPPPSFLTFNSPFRVSNIINKRVIGDTKRWSGISTSF